MESDITQRVVPAAMVYSFAEGLLVHATMQHTGFAFLNMELNVVGPTFAGDTIHVECEVIESRRSNSRPNRRSGAHPEQRGEAGCQDGADLYAAAHGEGTRRRLSHGRRARSETPRNAVRAVARDVAGNHTLHAPTPGHCVTTLQRGKASISQCR